MAQPEKDRKSALPDTQDQQTRSSLGRCCANPGQALKNDGEGAGESNNCRQKPSGYRLDN